MRCHADGSTWATGDKQTFRGVRSIARVRPEAPLTMWYSAEAHIADCNSNAALIVHRAATDELQMCTKECLWQHTAVHPNPGFGALLEDGTWIYAQSDRDVVGLWHQRFATRFYRRADAQHLVGIVVLRGRPHLLIRPSKDVLRIVPVPRPAADP